MKANGYRYSEELKAIFKEKFGNGGHTSNEALQWVFEQTGRTVSKATLANWVSPKVKENQAKYQETYRDTVAGMLSKRLHRFRKKSGANETYFTTKEAIEYLKIKQDLDIEAKTCRDFYSPSRIIDLSDTSSWHIDHKSLGSNELENLAITSRDFNQMKADLSLEQLKTLYKEYLENTNSV